MNPTKQQVQTVIDTLQAANDKVLQAGWLTAPVGMMTGNIHPCGTPMCHGGYYAMIRGLNAPFQDYLDGAELIATDLGFETYGELEVWAGSNPEIWGNTDGACMFFSSSAFVDGAYVEDLQVIIDHWKRVQTRLPE